MCFDQDVSVLTITDEGWCRHSRTRAFNRNHFSSYADLYFLSESLTNSGLSFVTFWIVSVNGRAGRGMVGFLTRSPFAVVFGAGAQSMPKPLA